MNEICEPRTELCQSCGEDHTYYCGRLLQRRDPTDPEQACLDGMFACADCVEGVREFITKAFNARAVRQEWDGG